MERGCRSVAEVRVADTALVVTSRIVFNPLFGTNRKNQKRDLAKAWKEARALTEQPGSPDWLCATLSGVAEVAVPDFTKAGTWFMYNNKAFNSGLDWSREGSLSPWSFLLAMEGALLLTGGAGRRLSARAYAYALFPFLSQPLQPEAHSELEHGEAEFWGPIWSQPATLREVKHLFIRGLAKIGGRAASAPHEFAVAALGAGTDAGVSGFARFEIRQTTSAKVYEAVPRGEFQVADKKDGECFANHSTALMEILGPRWFDRLPSEPTSKRSKKKFTGLRGPIERLILAVGQAPDDAQSWQALLLQLAQSQNGVDRNLNLRKACRALPRLGVDWFRKAFPDSSSCEIRIAAALASLGANTDYPAVCNIYGVEIRGRSIDFVRPGRPQRAVWHSGDPLSALLDLIERRLTDAKEGEVAVLQSALQLTSSEIAFFLSGEMCELAEVQKWIPPLTLLRWFGNDFWQSRSKGSGLLDPNTLLWAFFKPFFHPAKIEFGARSFFLGEADPKPAFARQLFALLRSGSVSEAIAFAQAGWRAQGHRVIVPPLLQDVDAPRLAAALALPISSTCLARLAGRWLEPSKNNQQ
jgi:CRISPR-associated protein Csx17